jgi:RNA polymerase II subunit A-like phosphatase
MSVVQEARRLEDETTTRLRNARKLSLIVDLDQTIVHATVDPTVAEWMGDETNPNYNALKDVKKFWLANGVTGPKTQGRHRPLAPPPPAGGKPGRAEDGCWYYIKMR